MNEEKNAQVKIQTLKNGPLLVQGPVQLVDDQGNPIAVPPGASIALCRCGHSEKKPFCDGHHKKVGFQG